MKSISASIVVLAAAILVTQAAAVEAPRDSRILWAGSESCCCSSD
jgi:hypothetical protein